MGGGGRGSECWDYYYYSECSFTLNCMLQGRPTISLYINVISFFGRAGGGMLLNNPIWKVVASDLFHDIVWNLVCFVPQCPVLHFCHAVDSHCPIVQLIKIAIFFYQTIDGCRFLFFFLSESEFTVHNALSLPARSCK